MSARYGKSFRILKGIESDILPDGSLDYPDEVLARFDFVVASVHGRFKLDGKTQTQRIIRAVENPFTTILGHMTGRQLLPGRVTTSISRPSLPPAPPIAWRLRSTPIRGGSIWTGVGIAALWSWAA